jgi:hypothetical protein
MPRNTGIRLTATSSREYAAIARLVARSPLLVGITTSLARSYSFCRNTVMARKCGSCQTNKIAKSTRAGAPTDPVTLAQPINGGIAPGTAPTCSAKGVTRFIGV